MTVPESACNALWSVITGDRDELLLLDWADGSRREKTYFPCSHDKRFEGMLAYHSRNQNDPRVGLVPRRDKHPDGIGAGSCLWASCENSVSVRVLNSFKPAPTLIFKNGGKRVAIWWLDRTLPMLADPKQDWLTKANRRLAFALKANSRHAAPEWLMPLGELIVAEPDRRYAPAQVVGRLRDAPERKMPALRAA